MIPDNAKLRYIVRAPKRGDVADLRKRVKACFEFVASSPPHTHTDFFYSSHYCSAAALATGCGHDVKLENAYDDLVQNSVLGPRTLKQREFKSDG